MLVMEPDYLPIPNIFVLDVPYTQGGIHTHEDCILVYLGEPRISVSLLYCAFFWVLFPHLFIYFIALRYCFSNKWYQRDTEREISQAFRAGPN